MYLNECTDVLIVIELKIIARYVFGFNNTFDYVYDGRRYDVFRGLLESLSKRRFWQHER